MINQLGNVDGSILSLSTTRQMSMKKGNVVAVIESTSVEDILDDTGKTMEINEISTGDKCVIHNERATQEQIGLLQKID